MPERSKSQRWQWLDGHNRTHLLMQRQVLPALLIKVWASWEQPMLNTRKEYFSMCTFCLFLGPHSQHVEVPGLGVELEL